MRLTSIKLRGAIGIKKGLGLDEVAIDLTKFGPGLIALTGKNGSGKTTLLEQMHFYRTTVSHDGSLQGQFFLKNSHRIVEGIHCGVKYEGNIKIDALTDNCEAYLFQVNSDGSKIPLNDGLRGTYDEALEKVMGTEELFFNSAFAGQISKGIASLKTADRRKLFNQLLNLAHYEKKCEIAKSKLRDCEEQLSVVEGKITLLTAKGDTEITEIQGQIDSQAYQKEVGEKDIIDLESKIATHQAVIKDCEIQISKFEEKVKANQENENKICSIEKKIKDLTAEHNTKINRYAGSIKDYNTLIERDEYLLKNKQTIADALTSKAKLMEQKNTYQESLNKLNLDYSELQKKISGELKTLGEKEKELSLQKSEVTRLENGLNETTASIARASKVVDNIKSVPCTSEIGTGCKYLIEAYSKKDELPTLEEQRELQLTGFQEHQKQYLSNRDCLEREKAELDQKHQTADKNLKNNIDAIKKFLDDINAEIASIDKGKFEDRQKQLDNADAEIKDLLSKIKTTEQLQEEAVTNFNNNLGHFNAEIKDLRNNIHLGLASKIEEIKESLRNEKKSESEHLDELKWARKAVEELAKSITQYESEITTIQENLSKALELETEKVKLHQEIKEWQFFVRAYDKTGIPVLKMENSGTAITSLANELLNFYNEQSRIKIETTKLSKDKKKVIESFDIIAIDKHGIPGISNTMDIKDKSGGEKVWYQSALQGAISIFKNQNAEELTVFFDEQDGPLDSYGAVERYFEMLSKVHIKTKAYQTILITHRPEIIDMIPQQIKLKNGTLQLIN